MNLYVTTDEIKSYMGISGSAQDTLIAMFNKMATDVVNGAVLAKDLSLHKIVDEAHKLTGQYVDLNEPHVVAIGTIRHNDEEYTQDEAYDILGTRVLLDEVVPKGTTTSSTPNKRTLKVTYGAGWNASGTAIITVTDYANIAASATITLGAKNADGFTITRGVDWTAGTSNNDEASKIATALDAKPGVNAFSLANTIYVIEATAVQVTGRTIATSDSTRLALSGATLANLDMPESIRLAVMMYVSVLMNNRKNPKLKSYTIGSKTVTFSSDAEFNTFNDLLKPFRRVGVTAI